MRALVRCKDCLSSLMIGEGHSDAECLAALSAQCESSLAHAEEVKNRFARVLARVEASRG